MEPAATRVTLDLASFEAPPAQLLRTQLSLHVRVSIVRSGLDVPVPTLGFRIVVSNWDNGMRGNYCDGKPTGPQDGGPGYGGGSSGRGGTGAASRGEMWVDDEASSGGSETEMQLNSSDDDDDLTQDRTRRQWEVVACLELG